MTRLWQDFLRYFPGRQTPRTPFSATIRLNVREYDATSVDIR